MDFLIVEFPNCRDGQLKNPLFYLTLVSQGVQCYPNAPAYNKFVGFAELGQILIPIAWQDHFIHPGEKSEDR